MADNEPTVPFSPEWWLEQLAAKLEGRRRAIKVYEDYYAGEHKLAFATQKFREAFGSLFEEFADDWTQLVVDAVEERLDVVGFRVGRDVEADDDLWELWQRNNLDAGSQQTHVESLVTETAGVIVWVGPDGETPLITPERASEVIVAVDRATGRRLAALKMWDDEWTGDTFAYVYLPEGIYKYRKVKKPEGIIMPDGVVLKGWAPREINGETWPLANPLGEVSVVPFPNRPRLGKDGVSEIKKVVPIQDGVNKLVADMLVASEFTSFRQRWATGIEIPIDPITKEPIEVFQAAMNRLWLGNPPLDEDGNVVEGVEPKFGEFGTTDLRNFVVGVEMLVQHIASQSRTPPHYFYLKGEFPSGESLRSAEAPLVKKAERKQTFYGEAWEEVMRLAVRVADPSRDVSGLAAMETVWGDAETRTESEHIDALVKLKALGVPNEVLWEKAGLSPTEIRRAKAMIARDGLMAALLEDSQPGSETEPQPQPEEEPVGGAST